MLDQCRSGGGADGTGELGLRAVVGRLCWPEQNHNVSAIL